MVQVEDISDTLIMRWVNVQLNRVSEWVDRTLHQEVVYDSPITILFFQFNNLPLSSMYAVYIQIINLDVLIFEPDKSYILIFALLVMNNSYFSAWNETLCSFCCLKIGHKFYEDKPLGYDALVPEAIACFVCVLVPVSM